MFFCWPELRWSRPHALPVATILLVVANALIAIWTLPNQQRAFELRRAAAVVAMAGSAHHSAGAARLAAAHSAARVAQLQAADASDPARQWGYDATTGPWRALSALFLHAGWTHLLGNLAFLLALGLVCESRWGPARTLGTYLGVGVVALWLDARLAPGGVLVGASAAVAALLGAWAHDTWRGSVRWGFVLVENLRLRKGSFEVPAAVLLGLWLLQQAAGLVSGPIGADAGIAYVAHLGGFALGLLAARLGKTGFSRQPA